MDETASKAETFAINSERLSVTIAQPGKVYAGTRFDWSGFITQVTLDGSHTFCAPEALTPGEGTGGIGLCNEFGIDQPIGYGEAHPGETFPKIGIGLLVRPDREGYDFSRPYRIARRFPLLVEQGDDWARFVSEPVDCRGYSARLTKRLSVQENRLEIAYLLENTGLRPIQTDEYAHNFLAIDGQPIGPDYRLTFAYPLSFEPAPVDSLRARGAGFLRWLPGRLAHRLIGSRLAQVQPALNLEGRQLRLTAAPDGAFYARLLGFHQTDAPQWELEHLPSRVKLCESVDFSPSRLAVWGTSHVISAEVFVNLTLAPGARCAWHRRYAFWRADD